MKVRSSAGPSSDCSELDVFRAWQLDRLDSSIVDGQRRKNRRRRLCQLRVSEDEVKMRTFRSQKKEGALTTLAAGACLVSGALITTRPAPLGLEVAIPLSPPLPLHCLPVRRSPSPRPSASPHAPAPILNTGSTSRPLSPHCLAASLVRH